MKIPSPNGLVVAVATLAIFVASAELVAAGVSDTKPRAQMKDAPVVTFTYPMPNASFSTALTPSVPLRATVADPDDAILAVNFAYCAASNSTCTGLGVQFASVTAPPYEVTFTPPPVFSNVSGPVQYVVWAYASNASGQIGESARVPISFVEPQLPFVTLVVPGAPLGFVSPATPILYATAFPGQTLTPSTIVRVDFFDGADVIGSVSTENSSPNGYAFAWSSPAIGAHSISVRAVDSVGNGTTSASVPVYILPPTISPSVTLTSPRTGEIFNSTGVVPLSASVMNTQGSVPRVEFFAGAIPIASVWTPPYTASWTSPPSGDFAIVARVYDDMDMGEASLAAHIHIMAEPRAPAVVLTAPAPGASLSSNPLFLSADAVSPDGAITRVDFYSAEVLLGGSTARPYTFVWNSPSAGNLSLSARAYDANGMSTRSAPVAVQIPTGNQLPSVRMVSPSTDLQIPPSTAIALGAVASDADGTIVKVDFYVGSDLVGTVASPPYRVSWSPSVTGAYTVTARATDDSGGISISAPVNITVNTPPSVALVSPLDAAQFPAGSSIPLSATASDVDGSVSKVDFFAGNTLIGSSSTSPYTLTWNSVPSGTYALTARATDNQGAYTASAVANVIVGSSAAAISLAIPVAGATFGFGESIGIGVDARMPGKTIYKIEIYGDANLLWTFVPQTTVSGAVISYQWSGAPVGAHTVSAKAFATDATVVTTGGVAITVVELGILLNEPFNGQFYLAPGDVAIGAEQTGPDGAVTRVDFVGDGVTIGSLDAAPFRWRWSNVPSGGHTAALKITYASGFTINSGRVSFTVINEPWIRVDGGIDRESVADDRATVSGTVQAPINSALLVNGKIAVMDPAGRFVADEVILKPGVNSVQLALNSENGTVIQTAVFMTSTGTAPFTVSLDRSSGIAPLSAALTITNRGNIAFRHIDVSWHDSDTADQVITRLQAGSHTVSATLNAPGWFTARVTVYDESERVLYQARRKIHVDDAKNVGGVAGGVYNRMLDRLSSGNVNVAVMAITDTVREVYRSAFARIGSRLPAAVQSLGKISSIMVSETFANISVVREVSGTSFDYRILLIRDNDGIWKIDGM